jgi:hypothetical protein
MRTTLFLPFILFYKGACAKSQFYGEMVLTGEIAISWRETNCNATFFYPKPHMQGHSLGGATGAASPGGRVEGTAK